MLPPPACTVPTELVAVLLPEPLTDVGTEALACVAGSDAEADGFAVVLPT